MILFETIITPQYNTNFKVIYSILEYTSMLNIDSL